MHQNMPDEMPSLEPSITFNARSGKILESESSEPWWIKLILLEEGKHMDCSCVSAIASGSGDTDLHRRL